MKTLKFDVFGRTVVLLGTKQGWKAYYAGSEGKRCPADDIIVPPSIVESELVQYLDDLCHEWATDRHPHIRRLD